MTVRYFEDFVVGQTFSSGRTLVEREQIKRFASEFDPQPFHLDENTAQDTIFRGLAASGWHTAAVTMRLILESDLRIAGGVVGQAIKGLEWRRPVRPGDRLQVVSTIADKQVSSKQRQTGLLHVATETRNQDGELVLSMRAVLILPRRTPPVEDVKP